MLNTSRCVGGVVLGHVRQSSSLSAASRRWAKGQLKQWSLFPRRAAKQPVELAVWDKLVEPQHAVASATLPKHLSACVGAKPFGEALAAVGVEEDYTWDYPTLEYLARGCAAGLVGMGHKHGSAFATWMHTGPEAVLLSWAASMAGCVHIAIDPKCSFEEVKDIIAKENVRTLYFQERLNGKSVFEDVASLARNAHDGTEVNWLDSKKYRSLKQLVNATGEAYTSRTMTLSSCTPYDMEPNPVDYISPWLHVDQPTMVTFSKTASLVARSGPFTGADVLSEAARLQQALQLTADDRVLLCAPAASLTSMAAIVAATQAQAKLITVGREFSVPDIVASAAKQRPSALVCTAEQAAQLQDQQLPGLRRGAVTDVKGKVAVAGVDLEGVGV